MKFTEKQGQYLAFIYNYSIMFRKPPAEADLMDFFETTPPTVHQMILRLNEKGLISRQPGVARSIELLVDPEVIPQLKKPNWQWHRTCHCTRTGKSCRLFRPVSSSLGRKTIMSGIRHHILPRFLLKRFFSRHVSGITGKNRGRAFILDRITEPKNRLTRPIYADCANVQMVSHLVKVGVKSWYQGYEDFFPLYRIYWQKEEKLPHFSISIFASDKP